MNEQPPAVSWMETEYSPSQPATYTMEVNGTTYGPLVDLDLFTAMREERDAARTRLQEVEAAHKQTIRHATALGEERDELKAWQAHTADHLREIHAWWEADQVAIPKLVTMWETAEAERDQATRQRDHARATAHAWYVYFLSTGEHVMDSPECPPNLSGADDDGWSCQHLNDEEQKIIGCPDRPGTWGLEI